MQRLEVRNQRSDVRLDVYLAESDLGLTRSHAKQLIEKGFVQVKGKRAKASLHLEEGDVVHVTIPPPESYDVQAEDIPLDVIFEDEDVIVINKPVGMVVHPAVGNFSGTLVNALLGHCKDLSGIGGELKPGIVHRLDKGTSGIMVAAKNDQAHQNLSKQFMDRTVTKIYGALVYGVPQTESGVIDKPIGRSMKDRKRMSTRTSKGRIALTEWKVLERFNNYLVWLEVNLGTGRTHQIRVHLSAMGHPLVGDDTYGRGGPNRVKAGNLRKLVAVFDRPALHAWKLGFDHPRTGERVELEATLPNDLVELLERLRGV
jgi:23S rRNA pseudouridine1911/1915/1917 synthase